MTASVRSTAADNTDAKTSYEHTLPATVVSGDLLLLFASADGNITISIGTEVGTWTQLDQGQTDSDTATGSWWALIADGTEDGATVTISYGSQEAGATTSWAIQDWFGTIATGVFIATATGTTDEPNPPALDPSLGSLDFLWIAGYTQDRGDSTASAYPTDYSISQQTQAGGGPAGGNSQASALQQLTASSENPAVFTSLAIQESRAMTLAIRPVAAGGVAAVPSLLHSFAVQRAANY